MKPIHQHTVRRKQEMDQTAQGLTTEEYTGSVPIQCQLAQLMRCQKMSSEKYLRETSGPECCNVSKEPACFLRAQTLQASHPKCKLQDPL